MVLNEPISVIESRIRYGNVTITNFITGASTAVSFANRSQVVIDSVMVAVSSNGAVIAPSDDNALDATYTGANAVQNNFDGFVNAGRVLVLDAPDFLTTVAQSSG